MNFAPTDEQKMVREMVRKYSESHIKPIAAELDRTHRHPEEICRELGEMGIMGVAVPTEYDGAGMDNVTYVMALIEISKACASCGVIVSVNNSLYGYPVNTFGTEEQKRKYLSPVAGGKVEEKMGILASGTAELVFEEAEVPAENLLGRPGQGFRQMLSGLDAGRIGIGAQACGIGRAALEDALEYAKERVQFGKPIATFQAIQFKLADMATELDAAELMLLRAAWLEDNGIDFEKEAAQAKYYASDVAMRAAIEGVQIFGGYGYIKEYPAERHMRDAKICQIYEGTNEIQRIVVARKLIGLR
ncbi:MAG: acyl-CoA dehydrogenase family protein [Proteobacteria bacterium]|nr:acyl-CoA dehydrogenase family protein [Pseudomonadota bacterium]